MFETSTDVYLLFILQLEAIHKHCGYPQPCVKRYKTKGAWVKQVVDIHTRRYNGQSHMSMCDYVR